MVETRKLVAILAADVVGYSRLAGSDEDRTLARLRALRSDLIDPTIAVHNGRVVKRTGDGSLVEFRSVVDAVRCAIEVQNGMVERNAGLPPERRIEFRVGIHLGDVVEESDGDLMGDGFNIAARLEGIAKPGAICLSEDAYRQVKARLDLAVSDLGATQLKNIAEPVHVYSLEVGKPAKAKPKAVATDRRRLLMPVIGGIAAVIVIIAALAGWQFLARQKPGASAHAPPRLSMVVLPFANLSGDSSQDYLADSITENLTTELSHIRHSFVIARNTAFTFKGKSINAKEIGRELDVRYVMEGSVQRDGHRVRVNAQLIDAESGAHIWAERFENDLADLFKLQDEVVARLARSLQMELVNAEVLRTLHDRSQNPDSIDLTLRGFALINQGITKAFYAPARDAFDQALKLDPNNADALAGAAFLDMRDYLLSWSGQPDVDFHARAMQRANEAILASMNQPYAHLTKTYLLMFRANPGDVARANEMIAEAEAALRADPSLATAYLPMSVGKELIGRYEEALSDMDRAIRISPHDPYVGLWHEQKGRALLGLGRHDEAIQEGVKAIDEGYRTIIGYTALAAFYAAAEKVPEAEGALAEAMKLNPKLSVAWFLGRIPSFISSPPGFRDNLKKAGLPEE